MIHSGLKPTRIDHRDFDFIKSKALGGVSPSFPENYCVDAGLWMPDQSAGSTLFNPNVPPMPYGCTNYAQNDLCIDEDGMLFNPSFTESITHADENGGTDLRTSLKAIVKYGVEDYFGTIHKDHHPAFYNIQAKGIIDWFDAMRLAMISASNEHRGVSVGTPWFPEFGEANGTIVVRNSDGTFSYSAGDGTKTGIMPELTVLDTKGLPWHNWCVKGWKTINGKLYLIGKPWLGDKFGDKGFCYFSRSTFNALMSIPGTCAFTIDRLMPGEVETVDVTVVQWIVSFIRNLLGL